MFAHIPLVKCLSCPARVRFPDGAFKSCVLWFFLFSLRVRIAQRKHDVHATCMFFLISAVGTWQSASIFFFKRSFSLICCVQPPPSSLMCMAYLFFCLADEQSDSTLLAYNLRYK
ncbi:hypothetical protein BT96DRAFT_511578 [Gymnopus androsaceus JB14]|uniref:Uncharacterized protein n=1 Tax=Gymnopus androsaceus JB14 TaxID=1447944 RepID=A0A6A4I2B1_9AGAR|nr:hypothetical protein BT96DRAFT_511578 [Gymnopus androsaceus JB14]